METLFDVRLVACEGGWNNSVTVKGCRLLELDSSSWYLKSKEKKNENLLSQLNTFLHVFTYKKHNSPLFLSPPPALCRD